MKFFTILMLLGSFNSFAATSVKKIEILPPFLKMECRDNSSDLGLRLTKFNATDSANELSMTFTNNLYLCNSDKTLKQVDPFKGFEIPFFNFEANSLDTRKEIILSNEQGNRFELGLVSESANLVKKTNMSANADGSFSGTLKINKSEILNQNDLDALNEGREVVKQIEIFENSNMTTIVHGKTSNFGDINWSGRYVNIVLIKENSQIKLRRISL